MGAFGYFKDSEGNVMESLGDVRLDALPERASPRVSAPLRWVSPAGVSTPMQPPSGGVTLQVLGDPRRLIDEGVGR